ncbi:MAG: hypothetical protein ACK4WJ_03425 [Endomicrobiia bacterium]
MKKFLCFIFVIIAFNNCLFSVIKFYLDTEYKISYNNFSNIDFDFNSNDIFEKVYSNLSLNFKTLIDNFEFCSTLLSVGEVEDNSYSSSTFTYTKYNWEQNYPYLNIKLIPFFSQVYAMYKYNVENIKLPLNIDLGEIKINISVGKKRKQFLEGLVVGDNGVGYNGLFFDCFVDKYFYVETMLSRVSSSSGFLDNKIFTLTTFLLGSKYFESFDFGICSTVEKNQFLGEDKKIFYEFFITRNLKSHYYTFEYATQKGEDDNKKNYSGSLWFFKAGVLGESKFFGYSKAEVVWLLSSGGDKTSKFLPTFNKMYDGMELYGWGNFAKGNIKSLFFDLPQGYSGMFVLGFNLTVNPFKKFFSGFEYYLYSSPEAPLDKPDPSSTEKTLGAKKAIGLEYGVYASYKFLSYIDIDFCYSIFIPSKNVYSSKNDPSTKVSISTSVKF